MKIIKNKDLFLAWLQGVCECIGYDPESGGIEYRIKDTSWLGMEVEIRITISSSQYLSYRAYVPYGHPDKPRYPRTVSGEYTWDNIKTRGLRGFLETIKANVRPEYLA